MAVGEEAECGQFNKKYQGTARNHSHIFFAEVLAEKAITHTPSRLHQVLHDFSI